MTGPLLNTAFLTSLVILVGVLGAPDTPAPVVLGMLAIPSVLCLAGVIGWIIEARRD